MSEWKKVKLGDLTSVITKGTSPSNIGESFTNKGIRYIRSEMITQINYISEHGSLYISKETHDKLKRSQLKAGDILFSMAGIYLGKTAILRECDVPANTNQAVAIIRLNGDLCNKEYLYYFLNQEEVVRYVNQISGQAAQPNINLKQISNIEIDIPNKNIQYCIATILSRYDSLIENYQKQIKLLEESAQRLYKEWFIDLRFPGHENTKIVDGVPEGWEKKKLGDVSKTTSGGTPSRINNSFYLGSIMWVKTKELCDGFIFNTEEKITEEAIKKSSAKIVPAGSILMAMYGATIGKLGVATKDLTCNQACCVFLISEDNSLRWYIFNWLLQNRKFLISKGKGVAQPNLNQDMIKGLELIIPDEKSLRGYHLLINPIYLNIKSLQSQICQLTEARDRLLPKLISGEIKIQY